MIAVREFFDELKSQEHLSDNEKKLFVTCAFGLIDELQSALACDDVNPNCQLSHDGTTPLHAAVYNQEKQSVLCLLANETVDINCLCYDGATPLYIAAQNNLIDIVPLFLSANTIDVNKRSQTVPTPLYVAAQKGFAQIVDLLLAHDDTDANFVFNATNSTPLCIAAHNGHLSVVERMIACKKVNLHQTCHDGSNALDFAIYNKHQEIVLALSKTERTKLVRPKNPL